MNSKKQISKSQRFQMNNGRPKKSPARTPIDKLTHEIFIIRDGRRIGAVRTELDIPSVKDRVYATDFFLVAIKKNKYLEEDTYFDRYLRTQKKWEGNLAAAFIFYRRCGDELDGRRLLRKAYEDVYLRAITAYGLRAFRHPEVNQAITALLMNKKGAGNFINRIAKALMEHAGVAGLPLKPGKPEAGILSAIGKAPLRSIYEDLKEVLTLLKKDYKRPERKVTLASLPDYWDKYYRSLQEKYDLDNEANEGCYRKAFEAGPPYRGLADMIYEKAQNDPDFRDTYHLFRQEPSELAKALLGRLLGVSSSKVHSVVFR